MIEVLSPFLAVLILLGLTYGVGRWRELRHIRSLDERDRELEGISVTNLKLVPSPETIRATGYVSGEAVIATDYFKTFAAALRNLVGGEVHTYHTLMTRARREARLRMLAEANRMGAGEVWNVRYETSNVMSTGRQRAAACVEVFAYGTAVIRE